MITGCCEGFGSMKEGDRCSGSKEDAVDNSGSMGDGTGDYRPDNSLSSKSILALHDANSPATCIESLAADSGDYGPDPEL